METTSGVHAGLQVEIVPALDPGADAAVQVPGEPGSGAPPHAAGLQVSQPEAVDDGPDYANAALLRGGDSAQVGAPVLGVGSDPDLSCSFESGAVGGDGGE